jgi:hypothetical protein
MLSGNTSQAGDDVGSPDESFLFLLTVLTDPGIGLTGDRVGGLGKAVAFGPFWCALDVP